VATVISRIFPDIAAANISKRSRVGKAYQFVRKEVIQPAGQGLVAVFQKDWLPDCSMPAPPIFLRNFMSKKR
jgi:hypothetical protein